MTEPTRTFFRIVRRSMATVDDFRSAAAMGLPRSGQLEDGISVFATEAQARAKARQYRLLGDHIAQLEVPTYVIVERTLPRSRGHHTMWGPPEVLLGCVVAVRPVGTSELH